MNTEEAHDNAEQASAPVEAATAVARLCLDVYGVSVSISGNDADTITHLGEDFAHFHVAEISGTPLLTLLIHRARPPYDRVPSKAATVYTPRNVSFHDNGCTYIDYSGRALGIFHVASGRLDVFSEDADLLYETGYLFLLSQVGEKLDARRMHRIHSVAISVAGRAAIILLPMGGGKSTLATHLLSDPRVRFLSDDSPLVDGNGDLHAFPLRIGVLPGSEGGYAPEQLRTIQRMEFGPKLLVRYATFADRIVPSARPGLVLLGRRSLGTECTIAPASKFAAIRALIPNCVIGLGLFQGMEFVFNRDLREAGAKAVVAWSRLRSCIALVRRSSAYTVTLGRDLEKNAATLLAFMQEPPSTR